VVVPLRWKLVVMVAGIVAVVTAGLVVSDLQAHGLTLEAIVTQEAPRRFAALALANALVWTTVAAGLAGFFVRRITGPLSAISQAAARRGPPSRPRAPACRRCSRWPSASPRPT
jgi:hypothetical protein